MAQEKPNIFWIVCEDISPYLGAYGNSEVKTPNINDGKSTIEVPKPWKVYTGGTIPLRKGQTLLVNAQRIGYRPSENSYTFK